MNNAAPPCFCATRIRSKGGNRHRYWSVVENKRVAGGRVVQRHGLHLREINNSQELAWRHSIEVLDAAADRPPPKITAAAANPL